MQQEEKDVNYQIVTQGDLVKRINTKSSYLMDMIEEEKIQINTIEENSKKGNENATLG